MFRILLKANLKRHRGSLAGIFLLTFLTAAAFGALLSVWKNGEAYISAEIERAGFGELTAWVSGVPDSLKLAEEIEKVSEVEWVDVQPLIFSSYTVNGLESDSDGQLIVYEPGEGRYRFLSDELSGYGKAPEEIRTGEVYVSPSMISMFGVEIGDRIIIPVARAGKSISLTVRGFYEDPFMGSSMIGMKGFLISETDYRKAMEILEGAGIDALARDGAMLHIHANPNSTVPVSELSTRINRQSGLEEYAEDVHSRETMAGFMLVLQNAFSGLLFAFVIVLLMVVTVVLGHSINSMLASDFVNMGILKTQGITAAALRRLQLVQYMGSILTGFLAGFVVAPPLAQMVSDVCLTTTGILIPAGLPLFPSLAASVLAALFFAGIISLRTARICRITLMRAIRGETDGKTMKLLKHPVIPGKYLPFRLACRQLAGGLGQYIGTFAVAVLLTFFAALVGRMNVWLGADGKGMMDAFNPADHDIGVQSFGELTREEFENVILSYTAITDTYALAMPQVTVNGVSYTANVIDEPERFHILEGRTCTEEDEIVLTEFLAADYGLSVGDTVTVRGTEGSGEYVVSGIYSCANDMGDNVGMSREGYLRIAPDHPNLWCWHYFLADAEKKGVIAQELEACYGGDVHVHENTWPGLFGIITAMHMLLLFLYGMVVLFILVVTGMTGNRILSAEQKDLGIYKAMGFYTGELRMTFAMRFGITAFIGATAGTALSAVFTDTLVQAAMKLAGISNFASHPDVFRLLIPGSIVTVLFTGFGWWCGRKMKKVPLTVLVSE